MPMNMRCASAYFFQTIFMFLHIILYDFMIDFYAFIYSYFRFNPYMYVQYDTLLSLYRLVTYHIEGVC